MSLTRLPLLTLLIAAAAAIVSGDAELTRTFVMDRAAAANGEWWRYITGSLVHFSLWHLALDVTTLLAAGLVIERRSRSAMGALLAFAGIGGTMAAMTGNPTLHFFGGLSGVAFGAVVLAALMLLGETGRVREVAVALLAICALKLGWELLTDRAMMSADGAELTIVAAAHVAGTVAALAIAAGRRARALVPVGLLLAGACMPSAVSHRTAPAGVTIAAATKTLPAAPTVDGRVTLRFPLRVAVVFAAEEGPSHQGQFANGRLGGLSAAEKVDITMAITEAVRAHGSVADAAALRAVDEVHRSYRGYSRDSGLAPVLTNPEVTLSAIGADSATDLVLAIGYEQHQRIRDLWASPVMSTAFGVVLFGWLAADTNDIKPTVVLYGAALAAGAIAYVVPSRAHRTITTVDITAYDPRTGRVLFRVARSGQRRGLQAMLGYAGAMRAEGEKGVSTAALELRAAIGEALTELERRARATPDEFEIVRRP